MNSFFEFTRYLSTKMSEYNEYDNISNDNLPCAVEDDDAPVIRMLSIQRIQILIDIFTYVEQRQDFFRTNINLPNTKTLALTMLTRMDIIMNGNTHLLGDNEKVAWSSLQTICHRLRPFLFSVFSSSISILEVECDSEGENENIICSICQETIVSREEGKPTKMVQLPCGHHFHSYEDRCCGTGNIFTWLRTSNKCPMCRQDVVDEGEENEGADQGEENNNEIA
jgi:hypothetical protein